MEPVTGMDPLMIVLMLLVLALIAIGGGPPERYS